MLPFSSFHSSLIRNVGIYIHLSFLYRFTLNVKETKSVRRRCKRGTLAKMREGVAKRDMIGERIRRKGLGKGVWMCKIAYLKLNSAYPTPSSTQSPCPVGDSLHPCHMQSNCIQWARIHVLGIVRGLPLHSQSKRIGAQSKQIPASTKKIAAQQILKEYVSMANIGTDSFWLSVCT